MGLITQPSKFAADRSRRPFSDSLQVPEPGNTWLLRLRIIYRVCFLPVEQIPLNGQSTCKTTEPPGGNDPVSGENEWKGIQISSLVYNGNLNNLEERNLFFLLKMISELPSDLHLSKIVINREDSIGDSL